VGRLPLMNARVLIFALAAGVVAAIAVAGVMMLLVLALLTSAGFQSAQDVVLPESELAELPETVDETTLTVHVAPSGTVLIGDREASVDEAPALVLESVKRLDAELSAADCTVVIRAAPEAPTGTVQQLIKALQSTGFKRFALRAAAQE